MKFYHLFIVLIFSAFCNVNAQDALTKNYVEGELLVLLQSSEDSEKWLSRLEQKHEASIRIKQTLSKRLNLHLIQFNPLKLETGLAEEVLSRDEDVLLVQKNHTDLVHRSLPSDPFYSQQWPFENIDAELAWNVTTGGLTARGDTIVVAVIDGGFDLNHPDLEDNYFVNRGEIPNNNIDDDNNGFVDDVSGWNFYSNNNQVPNDFHGTHVAGTVGAIGNNEVGVSGVNWNVKVIPLAGSSTLESTVAASYAYAYDLRAKYNETNGEEGAYVVATNSSFGVNFGQPSNYPLWCAMYDSLGTIGILSAGATINSNIDVDAQGDIPTACPSDFLISVTNTNIADVKFSGAGYGQTTIDLGAPGTNVYSTLPNSNYGDLTGTSMATPHVAGAIALMYSAICSKTLEEFQGDPDGLAMYVKNKLLDEGVDVIPSLSTQTVTSGRLNLRKAVMSVTDSCLNGYVVTSASTCGECEAEASVTAFGGVAPYSYQWSTGAANDSVIYQLCAGAYIVTITDAEGSEMVLPFGVSDEGGPVLQISKTDLECPGAANGEASVSGGFNYVWSNGQTGANANGFSAGIHSVEATDANNDCKTVDVFTILEPPSLIVSYDLTFPVNGNDGSIEANANGGTPPFTYLWEDGTTGNVLSNLNFGEYQLTITDENGCEYIETASLNYPEGFEERGIESLLIFPNPVEDELIIRADHRLNSELVIMDQMGRTIATFALKNDINQINLVNLSAGVYVLRFIDSGEMIQRKIIKL